MRRFVICRWIFLAYVATCLLSTSAFSNYSKRRRLVLCKTWHHKDQFSGCTRATVDFERKRPHSQSTSLNYGRNDNLFSGLAEIGIGFSIGVLWSEYYIIRTGCGPVIFSDTLERICYQGVIVLMGIAVFNRIVAQQPLEKTVEAFFGPLLDATLIQIRLAETVTVIAVVGAFIALGVQYQSGENMDGLSGIDVSFCRALRDS